MTSGKSNFLGSATGLVGTLLMVESLRMMGTAGSMVLLLRIAHRRLHFSARGTPRGFAEFTPHVPMPFYINQDGQHSRRKWRESP
jgi:hypothetical protein